MIVHDIKSPDYLSLKGDLSWLCQNIYIVPLAAKPLSTPSPILENTVTIAVRKAWSPAPNANKPSSLRKLVFVGFVELVFSRINPETAQFTKWRIRIRFIGKGFSALWANTALNFVFLPFHYNYLLLIIFPFNRRQRRSRRPGRNQTQGALEN